MADIEMKVDARSFSELYRAVKVMDAALAASMRSRIRSATRPVATEVRASALASGLQKASNAVQSRQRYSRNTAVIQVRVNKAKAEYARPGSSFRHPVFGNRTNWVSQPAQHQFFDKVVEANLANVVKELNKVWDDVAREAGFN